jgi:hypothetical protein
MPSANYSAEKSGRLAGCGRPLKMAVWRSFFKIKARQTAITVCSGLPHPTKQVQILKKLRQKAITICSGLLYPTMGSTTL